MAAATSPATGQAYGVKRVCAIWGMARSSFYDAQRQDARSAGRPAAGRHGPKPVLSDADLLAAIRRDLDRSPWSGEGHRKVWARLRVLDAFGSGRTRVLRIMRENSLLSPHRRPPRPATEHDGSITTDAPNMMWGPDTRPHLTTCPQPNQNLLASKGASTHGCGTKDALAVDLTKKNGYGSSRFMEPYRQEAMLMRLGIHVIIVAAFVPLLPFTVVYGADLYDVRQRRPHSEGFSINEQHAMGGRYRCVYCELNRQAASSATTRDKEQDNADPSTVIDVAAMELDLSSGTTTRATEGNPSGTAFRCPETAPVVTGALTSAGLINLFVSLGMVTMERARSACDALARENSSSAHAQDEAPFRFSRPLSKGMKGPDVRELQRFLNTQGFVVSEKGDGSPGNETDVFGSLTVEAVKRYQKTYSAEILDPEELSAPSGIFGLSSIRKANRLLGERRQ
jgi:hypothetical protein